MTPQEFKKVAEDNKLKAHNIVMMGMQSEKMETPFQEMMNDIAGYLAENSKTFVADIAKKYKKYTISEKQGWCIVYEMLKIN